MQIFLLCKYFSDCFVNIFAVCLWGNQKNIESMSKSSSSSSGVGFTSLLQLLFIALKLLNVTVVATWSWWWVLSPTWITASLAIVIVGAILLYAILKK